MYNGRCDSLVWLLDTFPSASTSYESSPRRQKLFLAACESGCSEMVCAVEALFPVALSWCDLQCAYYKVRTFKMWTGGISRHLAGVEPARHLPLQLSIDACNVSVARTMQLQSKRRHLFGVHGAEPSSLCSV